MEKIYIFLSYYIYNAFGIFAIYLFNKTFFDRSEVKRGVESFAYIAYFIVISIIYQLWNNPLLTIGGNVLICFLITCLYKAGKLKRLLLSILINSIFFLFESIAYVVVINYKLESLEFVLMFLSTFATFIFVVILNKIFKNRAEKELTVLYWSQIFLIPCISIGIAFVLVLCVHNTVYTGIALIGLLIINFLIFHLYDELAEIYTAKYEKDILSENNKAYLNEINIIRSSNENLRNLKHDLNNHILTMKDMIKNDKSKSCLNYLKEIQDKLVPEGKFVYTGNPAVDGILNYKLQRASELGIKLNLDLNIPNSLNIKEFDLTVILGNLVDNAIESAQKCCNKFIGIKVEFDKGILTIDMVNPYLKKDQLPYEKEIVNKTENGKERNKRRFTTKRDKDNHGFGLLQIKKIAQSYNGKFLMTFEKEECHCRAVLFAKY